MKKSIQWLGGLLVAQLVLVAITFTTQAGYQIQAPQGALLQFESSAIDTIKLSDGLDELEITKSDDGQWRLPALESLPADPALVDEALSKLSGLQEDWPLTTTDAAHDRFLVADDGYERKIELVGAEQTQATLLLGDSPGFKKSHARVAGTAPVYSLEINAFEYPVEAESWLNKSLLALEEVTFIKGDKFELTKLGVDWQLTVDGKITEYDAAKVNQLVGAIAHLRVSSLAESPISEDAEVIELEVAKGGATYTLFVAKDGDNYWATRSDITTLFNLGQYQFAQISSARAEQLVPEPEDAKSEGKTVEGEREPEANAEAS